MTMNKEQFEAMVQKLESYAERNPSGYRTRVGLLAALGYSYVWFVLAVVLTLVGGLVWLAMTYRFHTAFIKVGLVLLVFAFLIVRSLWVRFPRPEGIVLTRERVPKLFAMIDEVTTALQAPRFHHVLLSDDFNAAVVQRPKLGVFGWQENYLLLGLPLLQALPPEQFRAVVAHEMGHLSGNHSRFAGWIYRVAATWDQIRDSFSEQGSGGFVFEKFLNWYSPFFNAYSFVLRRADEYVADRCAAQLAGAQVAGDALINVEVKGHFLNRHFWPAVYKRAESENEPPTQTFASLSRAFHSEIKPQDARTWIATSLREETDYDDTHPSLLQRLKSLGYTPLPVQSTLDAPAEVDVPLPASSDENAATHFLGAAADELTQQLDEAWREEMAPLWNERHAYVQESQGALQEIEVRIEAAQKEGKAAHEVLSEDEMWDRARWTGELRDNATALPLLHELLQAHPEHAPGHYALGQTLLEEGDEAGVGFLESAMRLDADATLEACMMISNFWKERGRKEDAERYRERAVEHYELLQAAEAERSNISHRDTFLPPDLSVEDMQTIRDALRAQDKIGEGLLVRKQVQHLPDKPCYVLAISTRQSVAKFFSSEDNQKLIDPVVEAIKDTPVSFIFAVDDSTGALAKAMRKIDGAKIYSHKEKE